MSDYLTAHEQQLDSLMRQALVLLREIDTSCRHQVFQSIQRGGATNPLTGEVQARLERLTKVGGRLEDALLNLHSVAILP